MSHSGIDWHCLAHLQGIRDARTTHCSTLPQDSLESSMCIQSMPFLVASASDYNVPRAGPGMCGEADRAVLAGATFAEQLTEQGGNGEVPFIDRLTRLVSSECGHCFRVRADLNACGGLVSNPAASEICKELDGLLSTAHCLISAPPLVTPASGRRALQPVAPPVRAATPSTDVTLSPHARPEPYRGPADRPVVKSPTHTPREKEDTASAPSGVFSAGRAIAPLVLAVLALVIFS